MSRFATGQIHTGSLGVSHGLLYPRVDKMEHQMIEMGAGGPPAAGSGPPPQVAKLADLGKQVGMLSTVLDIALVTIIVLMVSKPGV